MRQFVLAPETTARLRRAANRATAAAQMAAAIAYPDLPTTAVAPDTPHYLRYADEIVASGPAGWWRMGDPGGRSGFDDDFARADSTPADGLGAAPFGRAWSALSSWPAALHIAGGAATAELATAALAGATLDAGAPPASVSATVTVSDPTTYAGLVIAGVDDANFIASLITAGQVVLFAVAGGSLGVLGAGFMGNAFAFPHTLSIDGATVTATVGGGSVTATLNGAQQALYGPGRRCGLFLYATSGAGGSASFSDFEVGFDPVPTAVGAVSAVAGAVATSLAADPPTLAIGGLGAGSYLVIPDAPEWGFGPGEDFALEITFAITAANGIVVDKADVDRWPYRMAVVAGHLQASRSDGTHVPTLTSAGSVNDGQWHQAVLSKSATSLRLLIDDAAAAATTDTTTGPRGATANSADIVVGAVGVTKVDELVLYRHPLPDAQALRHYQAAHAIAVST